MADPVTAIAAAVGVANAASKAVTGKSLAEHGKALAETLRAKLMGKIGAEVGAVVEGLLPAEKEAKVWDIETGECVATLEGHSNYVRCGVHCTFVMMWLRRRFIALRCFRTDGASCLRRATRRSRCGTWRPANAWRR